MKAEARRWKSGDVYKQSRHCRTFFLGSASSAAAPAASAAAFCADANVQKMDAGAVGIWQKNVLHDACDLEISLEQYNT
jgi:hypothetical protein